MDSGARTPGGGIIGAVVVRGRVEDVVAVGFVGVACMAVVEEVMAAGIVMLDGVANAVVVGGASVGVEVSLWKVGASMRK